MHMYTHASHTRMHTYINTYIHNSLNTLQLMELHLQFSLTKFDKTIGSLFALHFKNRPRKASVTHPAHKHKHTYTQKHTHAHTHARTHTRAHTSPRPRHSCRNHIPPDGPAFTIHTDKVRRNTWIALCSPFQEQISKSAGDTSSHINTNTHTHKIHTRTHTSPSPRHSCPDHIPPDGPAFAIHTDNVRRDTWIALYSPFQRQISKRVCDTSSHTNTNTQCLSTR